MVYVDNNPIKRYNKVWFHLLSDKDLDELHDFAGKIGLKRKWFQKETIPHYDITESRWHLAILRGAIVADNDRVREIIQLWRSKVDKSPK